MIKAESHYAPRPFQHDLHNDTARFSVWILHRRAGKSVCAINDLIIHAIYLATKRPDLARPRLIFMAPLKSQAKRIIWDYLIDFTAMFPDRVVRQTELSVELPSLNNARIYLLGADDPDVIRGIYADRVILDEYDQMPHRVFTEVIRPALADRKGSCRFSGTPKGRGNLHRLYTEVAPGSPDTWSRHLYTVDDTDILPEEELEQIRKETPEGEFLQEYYCSFEAAIRGAYYADIISSLKLRDNPGVGFFPYDPSKPVVTAWDLGLNDQTSIWFAQPDEGGVRIIDYHEENNLSLVEHIRIVNQRPYHYIEHYAPHDIVVREYTTGKTRKEVAMEHGIDFIAAPKLSVNDGIEACRRLLVTCRFNEETTERGLECLTHYRRIFNDKKDTYDDRPLHDWASHGADAFRTLAVCWHEDNFIAHDQRNYRKPAVTTSRR